MDNQNTDNPQNIHGTVEFLLRRMSHKGDLPSFSDHIIEINSKLSSLKALNLYATGDLAKIILKDFSLTNKLLRVVNSAIYGNLAGKITTISKAMMMLGFEKVRMLSATLMIFEHLENKNQAADLKEIAVESFVNGIIAMNLAESMKFGRAEEAFVCAMLHNLGKMLVICYFPEEYAAIKEQILQGIDENTASRKILGISLNELGVAVSRSWNFPDMIVNSMENPPPGVIEPPKSEQETMRNLTCYAHDLCTAVTNTQEHNWKETMSEISTRYKKSIPLPVPQIEALLDSAAARIDDFSEIVKVDKKSSTFLNKLSTHRKSATKESSAKVPGDQPPQKSTVSKPMQAVKSPAVIAQEKKLIVTNGINEIADVMKGTYSLGDVIYMILETMYRGFELNRVIFCLRDVEGKKIVGRFGLGENSEAMVRLFQIQISKASDIFNIAISQGRGIIISDATTPNIAQSLPQWYRESVAAPAFLVYPLIIRGNCLGLFYADKNEKGPLLTDSQCSYMEYLRDMALKVILQKHR
ncbi:MAG: HDOD domain-containing protein [Syntrophaceae bacterium]|nr:HDOD domain-containing protein [Syntrophaceae bacterium]